jgi:hypothetical protein
MPREKDWSPHKWRKTKRHKLQSFVVYNSRIRLGATTSGFFSEKKKILFALREEFKLPIGELTEPWRAVTVETDHGGSSWQV